MAELENYINSLKRKHTQRYYRECLDRYFQAIKTSPIGYFKNKKKKMKRYENDLKKFVSDINKLAPVTQKNYISVIKNFFLYNDIEFKFSFWKREVRNKIEDGGALTLDRAPTTDELKKILSYGDLKDRCLFSFLATNGMRLGETLQIQLSDLDLKHDPAKITVRSTYVKGKRKPRWTFVSDECKQLLQAWVEPQNGGESERERYLRITTAKIKSCRPNKSIVDDRVFPFGSCEARTSWYRLIHKAGLIQKSPETSHYELHVHALRKFFMSEMKLELPEVIVEAYAGHSKYLDEAYKRYSLQQLAGFYKKGMHRLNIFESPDVSGIYEQLKDKDRQIAEMKTKLDKFDGLLENKEFLQKIIDGLSDRLEMQVTGKK